MSTQYEIEDKQNHIYLKEKYNKETVVIYSGPSWEKWDFNHLQKGIGGSELHQIYLAKELNKLNYRVIVFADTPEVEKKDGEITWVHYSKFKEWIDYSFIDYFISERSTDPFKLKIRSKKNFVQIHDIFLLSPKEQIFLNKIDKFACLSQWHIDFVSKYHNIPKEKICLMNNGVDLTRFETKVDRNPYRLHWSSSWDRGLDNILYLWPFLKEQIPQLELHIFYGTYNWEESCKKRNDTRGLEIIQNLKNLTCQKDIFADYGRVNQKELAEEMKKASLWLYPTSFAETFCITAIECQAAGVPIIANNYAGLKTTLNNSAILLGNSDASWPYTKEGRIAFLTETISILKDKEKWEFWSKKGLENSSKFTWKNSAKQWQTLFNL